MVLHKNVYQYFYADMDEDDVFHLFFQDNIGNIQYSRLDGQSIKTKPVLNSKMPSVYNKQLYLAPFKNHIYFFYVLHHNNSFMLACQVLTNGSISNPKVVDYVSGSNLPCTILYDNENNIYIFYQSYDGKYLQLGYKKFTHAQKHWSDFTPVTKYTGNCEYPHAIIDNNSTIHLCYQRRTPKLFEMVYQQKSPDRNLWTPETIVHSSIHSFEDASILQVNESVIAYWVREDTIYYNTGSQYGNSWNKASRLNFPVTRNLQCLVFKSNSPKDAAIQPGIYPGTLYNGLNMAFAASSVVGDSSQLLSEKHSGTSTSGLDTRRLVIDAFKQIQGSIAELREGWSAAKDEMSKLSNAYIELSKEFGKYAIRLNMLESNFGQAKNLSSRLDALSDEINDIRYDSKDIRYGSKDIKYGRSEENNSVEAMKTPSTKAPKLDPDTLKIWEEWKEPDEWQELNERIESKEKRSINIKVGVDKTKIDKARSKTDEVQSDSHPESGKAKLKMEPPESANMQPDSQPELGKAKPKTKLPESVNIQPDNQPELGKAKPKTKLPKSVNIQPDSQPELGKAKPKTKLPESVNIQPDSQPELGKAKPKTKLPESVNIQPDNQPELEK